MEGTTEEVVTAPAPAREGHWTRYVVASSVETATKNRHMPIVSYATDTEAWQELDARPFAYKGFRVFRVEISVSECNR